MYYFERILYILEIDEKLLFVYRRSGLNSENMKNKILPFSSLHSSKPRFSEFRSGIDIGYIYKEFYFNERFNLHRKKINNFGKGVETFCLQLEEELPLISEIKQDINDIKKYVKIFNNKIKKFQNKNIDNIYYDWNNLNIGF
jgi:hypothetical protein